MGYSKLTIVCVGLLLCGLLQMTMCEFNNGNMTETMDNLMASEENTTKLFGKITGEGKIIRHIMHDAFSVIVNDT